MTDAFVGTYIDELYAIISQDFLNQGQSPDGFNLDQLNADLQDIRKAA
jgi:hypothetical protein